MNENTSTHRGLVSTRKTTNRCILFISSEVTFNQLRIMIVMCLNKLCGVTAQAEKLTQSFYGLDPDLDLIC